jgi:hypothetical protein
VRRLGGLAAGMRSVKAAESPTMPSPYEIARTPGGKHHGWYLQQKLLSVEELSNGIESFERQIAKHEGWIADPLTKTADFYGFDPRRQSALVVGWRQDIQRHRDCIEILRSVIMEKKA